MPTSETKTMAADKKKATRARKFLLIAEEFSNFPLWRISYVYVRTGWHILIARVQHSAKKNTNSFLCLRGKFCRAHFSTSVLHLGYAGHVFGLAGISMQGSNEFSARQSRRLLLVCCRPLLVFPAKLNYLRGDAGSELDPAGTNIFQLRHGGWKWSWFGNARVRDKSVRRNFYIPTGDDLKVEFAS